MARMCSAAGRLVQSNGAAAANQEAEMHDDAAALGERIMSLSFDLLARMLETGAGWCEPVNSRKAKLLVL